ncbi:uncharacterized protein LOC110486064 isoform X1 [Oncorhynchus mykiss]|uniref:uncharacterized protein LOC110486064 isoform X1 n=1 Tax=Oncorhynchus mykiss TaxID=8022 RepID=UPI0018787356|nr:uncharacterized protein LOC110486064 isoform X1 [Oncorhynchus mykiss]
MSEGVVRKIQPFTIGTRLSVPSEAKCQEFVDVYLPKSAAPDKLELHDQMSLYMGQSQGWPGNSELPQVATQVYASTPEGHQDERVEEDRNSVSPTASSRSIRKIAICRNVETAPDVSLCDSDLATSVRSTSETIRSNHNSVHPKPPSLMVEDDLDKRSNSQSKVDSWFKRKLRDLKYGCSVLGCPLQDPEDASPTQQRDLKDIENSLIQMTRSLDIKQDGHQYETLDVETGHEGEKRKRLQQIEGNKIPSGENTVNQTWLRFQSLLRNYHQDLKLALDVSSFYQQADTIICTINRKRSVLSGSDNQGSCGQTEIYNIASQIMMLNETVSRLSDLHPTLAARVTRKQAEVQESWGLLQEGSGSEWPDLPTTLDIDFSCDEPGSLSPTRDTEHEAQRTIGKDIKEEQNRLKGFENMKDCGVPRKLTVCQVEEQPFKSYARVSCDTTSNLDDLIGRRRVERQGKDQTTHLNTCSPDCQSELGTQLQNSTTSADKTLSWLKDNLAMSTPSHHTATTCGPDVTKNLPADIYEDNVVSNTICLDLSKGEKPGSTQGQHKGGVKMEDLLGQVETLWEVLRRRHHRSMIDANSSERLNLERDDNHETDKDRLEGRMSEYRATTENVEFWSVPEVKDLSETLEENDRGMLTELLRCLDQDENFDHCEVEEQQSTLKLRINQLLSRCAEFSMDILDTETDMAVRCEPNSSELEGLQEQQDELERDYQVIKEEVGEIEGLASQLQVLLPEMAGALGENVHATQQAWQELGWSIAENQCNLQQFRQLQDFLRAYLAMISWTEDTQTCIFSEASAQQWRLAELSVPSELDLRIEQKFDEFDKLAAAGQKLIKERHHLADIIKERTEELQSMLGWILVYWRAQKDQLGRERSGDSRRSDAPQGDASRFSQGQPQNLSSLAEHKSSERLSTKHRLMVASRFEGPQKSQPGIGHHGENFAKLVNVTPHVPLAVAVNSPSIILEEPCATVTPLGSSINLILSFDQQPPGGSLQQGPVEARQAVEPVHRVSTYLQVTDGSPVFEEVASPHITDTSHVSTTVSTSSTNATFIPQVRTVLLPTLPRTSSTSTLNLKGPMKRRKKITHRHTVTGIVGMPKPEGVTTVPIGATHRAYTWPLEDKKECHAKQGSPVNTELQLYIKNNSVVSVIDGNSSDTSSIPTVPTIQGHFLHGPNEMTIRQDKSHYGVIPLGSMLSFDLPKDWGKISQIGAKDLTTEKVPSEANGDHASPPLNLYISNTLGQTHESSKVIGQTFTLSPEKERHLEADGEHDSPNGSPSILCRPPGSNTLSLTQKVIGQNFTLSPGEESICKTGDFAGQNGSPLNLYKLADSNTLSQTHKVIGHTFTLSPKEERSCETARQDSQKVSAESVSLLVPEKDDVYHDLRCATRSPALAAGHENIFSSTVGIHDEDKVEVSIPVAILDSNKQRTEPNCRSSMHDHTRTEPSQNHKHNCLSVHTKIQDLNNHIYFPSAKRQFTFQSALRVVEIKVLSTVSEDSTWMGVRRSGRVIVCSEDNCCVCSDSSTPMMVLEKETSPKREPDHIHPDHWQFEEEEEELEDIWNGTDRERAP